jgi:ferritin-like metal-binding protein YciE
MFWSRRARTWWTQSARSRANRPPRITRSSPTVSCSLAPPRTSPSTAKHYEITRYGTLIARAKELGRHDCAALLQQNLDEEKAVDKKLTAMAESKVNRRAA